MLHEYTNYWKNWVEEMRKDIKELWNHLPDDAEELCETEDEEYDRPADSDDEIDW
nr:hypothetical protein [Cressdnaviricota sp.]